jgi:hypothetical protein
MSEPERRVHTFDTREVRRLGGLPFEKQVIEILFELDEPVPASKLRALLVPPPSDAAMLTMLDKLRKRSEIADYPHPSGDSIHKPLIGLPGWALRDTPADPAPPPSPILMNTAPTRLATAAPAQPTKENSMSKTKRAPRVTAEKADQAVETLLRSSTETLSVASIARDAELNTTATKAALKRLMKSGRVAQEGRGKASTYGAIAAPTTAANPTAAVAPIATPARKSNGKARFGFFSDGDVHIEAPRCTGVLSREEWKELLKCGEQLGEAA